MHLMSVLFILSLTIDDYQLFDFENVTVSFAHQYFPISIVSKSHHSDNMNQICKTFSPNSISHNS